MPEPLPARRLSRVPELAGVFGAGVVEQLCPPLLPPWTPFWTSPFCRPPVGTVPLRARSRWSRSLLCSSSSVLSSRLPSGRGPSCCSWKVGFFPMCVTRNLEWAQDGSESFPFFSPALFPACLHLQPWISSLCHQLVMISSIPDPLNTTDPHSSHAPTALIPFSPSLLAEQIEKDEKVNPDVVWCRHCQPVLPARWVTALGNAPRCNLDEQELA